MKNRRDSTMFKFFKALSLTLTALLLILSCHVLAAGSDEFINDSPPADNSVLEGDITLPTQDAPTLEDILDTIQSDPSLQENYDTAAQLFSGRHDKGIKVFVDGSLIDFGKYDNVQPVIENGSTLVPIRALSESLGASVNWDAGKRMITIYLGENTIELTLDSRSASVNGRMIQMAVPAKVINNRTMIPLRFVSESFGSSVQWHPYSSDLGIISITE